MSGALLPIAALAALFLLSGSKKAAAAVPATVPKAAPKGTVTLGPVTVIKRPAAKPAVKKPAAAAPKKSEAQQAAELAEKQLGAPKAQQSADVHKNVAQVVQNTALPAGYSRTAATSKAQATADHIRTRKGKYDRAVLSSFQTAAGLKSDGLYGPQTRNALVYFGAKNVPAALFKGTAKAYAPPAGG